MPARRRTHIRIAPFVIALLVVLMGLMVAAVPVSAHVALVAATPMPGSTIGQPPKAIRIRFDQVPDPKFNEITLLDTSGKSVAGGAATAEAGDPSVIEVTLTAKLTPGLYTVAWQALANDGHLTKGNYSFTLASGLGPAPPLEPQPLGAPTTGSAAANASTLSGSGNPSVLAVIVRWWRYLALGVLIGALGLAVIVLRPATTTLDNRNAAWRHATRMLRPWVFGGLIAFILAHLATLIVQAATVADISVFEVRADTLRRLVYNTTYGTVWQLIAAVALLFLVGMLATLLPFWRAQPPVLGVIAATRPGARAAKMPGAPSALWPWRLGLGVALVLAVVLTFSSHAIESQHQPLLAIIADAAHLSAMGLWFGGLLVLLATLHRSLRPFAGEARTAYLVAMVGRFSNLALASVACLIATGLYAMTLHTTRATILGTSYGQTLLIKHALILPLIATAALNLRVIKPHLDSTERARRWLPRLLGIEAALGLAVLLVTATLTQLPPAHLFSGANAALADPRLTNAVAVAPPTAGQQVDLSSGPQSAEMQDAAGMTVVLLTTTGKDGSALDANIIDPDTVQPLTDVQRVTALITFSGADLGQTSVLLTRDASGHYRATGIFFPIKGIWNVQLVIRRENVAEDTRLNFSFTSDPARFQAAEPPASSVTAARTGFLWPRLLPNAWFGLLLALVGAALFALTYPSRFRETLRGRTRTIYRAWSIGALLLGVIVFGYNSTDRTPTTGIANPLPNDTATIARGQQLFAQNCAICHGTGGKGDGPLGQNLTPRPADLTGSHLMTHTDGDLYWWVGHGIAGTGMPSFNGTLSDQDIWAIIRYVRSLHVSSQ